VDLNEKFNLAEIKFDFFKSSKAKEMEAQRELREKELIQ
jgi:3-dehydroquinate dehydratase